MVVTGSSFEAALPVMKHTLDNIAEKNTLDSTVYYTPAIRCQTSKKPTLNDIKRCNSFLKSEISIIDPKYVLIVGETAFKALLWDFNLITSRKPGIESFAGSHISKDGIVYIPVNDPEMIQGNRQKTREFNAHLLKFLKLINNKLKIKSVFYKEVESEKDMLYLLNTAQKTGKISIDIETEGTIPFLPEAEILTTSFTVKEGESFCVPFSWRTGAYLKKWEYTPKANTLMCVHYLKKILLDNSIKKIFHHCGYDMMWLEHLFELRIDSYEDTMMMKYLMNQNDKDRKALKVLIKEYTDMGYYEYNTKQYVGDGEPFSNIPPNKLMEYNNGDTDGTLRVYNILEPKLKELGLENIYRKFMLPNVRGLIELQKTGIPLNLEHCVVLKQKHENELVELYSKLKTIPQVQNFERLTGKEFNPGSSQHKMAIVYGGEIKSEEEAPRKIVNGKKIGPKVNVKVEVNEFNLDPITVSYKDPKTGVREQRQSFSSEAIKTYLRSIFKELEYLDPINTFNLDKLPDRTEVIKFIKIVCAINTIQTQLSNHIGPFIETWGRTIDKSVHASYNITGTTTGRLSASSPNLQNLSRNGFVKEAFCSRWGDEGVLLEADYKQLELFILAIVSQDPKLVYAFTHGIDIHTQTAANIVFRVLVEKVSKQMRTMAKTVNFGIIYGKTGFSLCGDLNMTEEEADEIIQGYFREYSGVKRYIDKVQQEARAKGFVTTIMGRRRYLDYSDPNGANRQAVNTTIQSPASDVCLQAVNTIQKYFSEISKDPIAVVCGTVHDSILVDCKKKHVNEIMAAVKLIMENIPFSWLTIPLQIDIKYGPNLKNTEEWDGESRLEL